MPDTQNALTIAADPTVEVNPLAAMSAGVSAAGKVMDLRLQQAKQAAGQAYQGAINPQTGEFDPNEFRRRLAASGPAAMAAGAALLNTQQISSDQLKQNLEKARWVNSTSGALLQSGDFSDAAMLGALHNGVAGGILTLPEAQRQLATMPPDAAGRQRWLQEHQDTSATFQEQMNQRFGTVGTEIDPSGRKVGTVQQSPRAGGGISVQPQAGAPLGLGAAEDAQPYTYTDAQGNVQHTTVGEYKRTINAQPGGQPRVVTPNAPPPPPGTQVRPPPAQPGRSIPGPSAGQAQDIEAYKAAQLAMPDAQKNLVAGQAALDALQLARSGPGTATSNKWKSFMIAQGIPGAELLDTGGIEAYQIARKNLLRFAQANGGKIGTDLGLSTQLESNPNMDVLLKNVNDHILKQDLGLARQRVAQTLTAPGQGGLGTTEFGKGMGAHVQNFTAKTDPVAFAWDLLMPEERQAHIDQVGKQQGGMERLRRSLKIASDTGMIKRPAQSE